MEWLRSRKDIGAVIMRTEGATLGYDHRTVLRGISLETGPGEILGLIGPNGCGKSTLIKGMSRVLELDAGHVTINDRDIAAIRRHELARLIAVVPQHASLPPAFTAFEVVLMGRTPHMGWFRNESVRDITIAWQAMEATGTETLAQRLVGELSGGERQRVTIARALAQEPEVMLLDEPTAHLDINYQLQIMDTVRKLCIEGGLAIVVALHDLNLAAQYCHKLVLLHGGDVYQEGAPGTVITEETIRDVYGVEACVSEHPLNRLPTTLLVPGGDESRK